MRGAEFHGNTRRDSTTRILSIGGGKGVGTIGYRGRERCRNHRIYGEGMGKGVEISRLRIVREGKCYTPVDSRYKGEGKGIQKPHN